MEQSEKTAKDNDIEHLSYITTKAGELSGYPPIFFD